jgi:predicted RNase H-like nuclease
MRYTGVDGCKTGWCVVTLPEIGPGAVRIEPDFRSVWLNHRGSSTILVDMPIGLLEQREDGDPRRRCDALARQLLGKDATSRVFAVPCRQAIYAKDKAEAQVLNQRHLERKISAQTIAIAPKIRQVDELLLSDPKARNKIFEVHPEILFYFLAGGNTLPRKRSREGEKARIETLKRLEPRTDDILNQAAMLSKQYVAKDDVLDALACAVTALKAKGNFQTLPSDVPPDPKGLPMQMVYWMP